MAKAIALIGSLPATITDRSIEISMKRKTSHEKVKRLPLETDEHTAHLCQKAFTWAQQQRLSLIKSSPIQLNELNDRALDNWTPLLAIASIINTDYLGDVCTIAKSLSSRSDDESIGTMLLTDLIDVFGNKNVMFNRDIVEALNDLEDRPWGEWRRGNPMTTRTLAKLLKPYKITSGVVRGGGTTARGIYRQNLDDAFKRYISDNLSVTVSQPNKHGVYSDFQSVTPDDIVTDRNSQKSISTGVVTL